MITSARGQTVRSGEVSLLAMQRRILERLSRLREGTTVCPGLLARDCGSTLKAVRPDLMALAEQGKIVLSQRGQSVKPEALKGPFRVRLP